jgi:hypothetical protein
MTVYSDPTINVDFELSKVKPVDERYLKTAQFYGQSMSHERMLPLALTNNIYVTYEGNYARIGGQYYVKDTYMRVNTQFGICGQKLTYNDRYIDKTTVCDILIPPTEDVLEVDKALNNFFGELDKAEETLIVKSTLEEDAHEDADDEEEEEDVEEEEDTTNYILSTETLVQHYIYY